MKKILIFILSCSFLLLGCGVNDTKYINAVKEVKLENGKSVNEYVNYTIKGIESYSLNKDKIDFNKEETSKIIFWGFLFSQEGQKEMAQEFKNMGIVIPEKSNLKWKIEGKEGKGKIVVVTTKNAIVKIKTEDNGENIEVRSENIEAYDSKSKKMLSKREVINASNLVTLLETIEKNDTSNKK